MTPWSLSVSNLTGQRIAPPPSVIEEAKLLNTEKFCNRCEEILPTSDFRFVKSQQIYYHVCKPCEREEAKEKRERRKLGLAKARKESKTPNICGSCYKPNPEFGIREDGTKARQCVTCLTRKRNQKKR